MRNFVDKGKVSFTIVEQKHATFKYTIISICERITTNGSKQKFYNTCGEFHTKKEAERAKKMLENTKSKE